MATIEFTIDVEVKFLKRVVITKEDLRGSEESLEELQEAAEQEALGDVEDEIGNRFEGGITTEVDAVQTRILLDDLV